MPPHLGDHLRGHPTYSWFGRGAHPAQGVGSRLCGSHDLDHMGSAALPAFRSEEPEVLQGWVTPRVAQTGSSRAGSGGVGPWPESKARGRHHRYSLSCGPRQALRPRGGGPGAPVCVLRGAVSLQCPVRTHLLLPGISGQSCPHCLPSPSCSHLHSTASRPCHHGGRVKVTATVTAVLTSWAYGSAWHSDPVPPWDTLASGIPGSTV